MSLPSANPPRAAGSGRLTSGRWRSWGLHGRPARAVLSAAGIALGIATMVGVLGISNSSRAQLVAQIDALGTNLLTSLRASPSAAKP